VSREPAERVVMGLGWADFLRVRGTQKNRKACFRVPALRLFPHAHAAEIEMWGGRLSSIAMLSE
jgi:hypothetical protein